MESWRPKTSVRLLHPFGAVLQAEGVALSEILIQARISREVYCNLDARIPYVSAGRFLSAADERSALPALGLQAARRHDAAQLQVLEYLAASSRDVGSALDGLVRHQGLFSDARVFRLEDRDEGRLLRYQPQVQVPRCFVEYVVGGLASVSLRASGRHENASQDPPVQVWFAYPEPLEGQTYRDFFGEQVVFDAPATGLLFPRERLTQRMLRANISMQELLERSIGEQCGRTPAPGTLADHVRALLRVDLAGTPTDLSELARSLRMSTSTLKRKLAAEGESYVSVLDSLRHDTALRLLARPELSVSEIAYLCGYAHVTAFNKAFKRWTSSSPSQWRDRR